MDYTDTYGVRLASLHEVPGVWPEVREHILGLLAVDSRLTRALSS